MTKLSRRKGLTLVELLVVCAILVIVVLVAIEWSGSSTLPPAPAGAELPTRFKVQKHASLVTTLDVEAGGVRYGTITQNGSWWTSFTYADAQGATLANAVKTNYLSGKQIEIKDASGRVLGTLKQEIFQGGLATTVYSVWDGAGREIAKSEKVSWGATKFTLKSGSRVIATIEKTSFLPAAWSVDIHVQDVVDPRILIVIAAFKTHADDN